VALVVALVVVLALALTGCASRSYLGAIADVRAGAQAAEMTSDAKTRAEIHAAVGRRILAVTDGIPDLPAPIQPPAEIVRSSADYCASAPAPAYEAPPPPAPSPWQQFRRLGDAMIFWGGIAFAAGATLSLVGWLACRLGWVGLVWSFVGSPITSGIARLAASLGGGSALLGTGVVWATIYWWAILLAVVLTVAIVGVTHRKGVAKLWAKVIKRSVP
jgi:hypothetical protein